MNFTNGLAKDEFVYHMLEQFPSVFDNTFSRIMLENIVNFGTADNFTNTKNDLFYFLKDMIPEIAAKDLIPFMDKSYMTREVLSLMDLSDVELRFYIDDYDWNISVNGNVVFTFEPDYNYFVHLVTQ